MKAALSVNGQLQPLDGAHLSARDRGFLLGDGLFETMRVRQGRVVRLTRHLARLRAGAAVIRLPIPWGDGELAAIISQTLAAGHLSEAVVRLTISRGVGPGRGLLPEAGMSPTLVVYAAPFDGYPSSLYEQGMRAIISQVRRNEGSPLASIKSLNYLENILARHEAAAQGADEALMLNSAGNVAGASAANLFLVLAGQLITPTLTCGALPGTVRQTILDHAPGHVQVRPITLADLTACEEAFLTNALLGVMPLTAVNHRPIGTGKPDVRTAAIADMLIQTEE